MNGRVIWMMMVLGLLLFPNVANANEPSDIAPPASPPLSVFLLSCLAGVAILGAVLWTWIWYRYRLLDQRVTRLLSTPTPSPISAADLLDDLQQNPAFRRFIDERARRMVEPYISEPKLSEPLPVPVQVTVADLQVEPAARLILLELIRVARQTPHGSSHIQISLAQLPDQTLRSDLTRLHHAVDLLNTHYREVTGQSETPLTTLRHRRSLTGEPNIVLESTRAALNVFEPVV